MSRIEEREVGTAELRQFIRAEAMRGRRFIALDEEMGEAADLSRMIAGKKSELDALEKQVAAADTRLASAKSSATATVEKAKAEAGRIVEDAQSKAASTLESVNEAETRAAEIVANAEAEAAKLVGDARARAAEIDAAIGHIRGAATGASQ